MEQELTLVTDQQSVVASAQPAYGPTPADLLVYAMKNGASIAEVREFMQLKREFDADEARKAFVADMAEFKKSPPEIIKDKLVGYKNKDGSVTGYMHATIGNVTEAIVAGLAAHGFSHRWTIDQSGPAITVACVLTHKQGHSESTTLTAQKDDSGKKNAIQQVASTVTYLQRYTLLAATGVATKDQGDDDGKSFDRDEVDTSIADEWIAKVKEAKTDADVLAVWNVGAAKMEKRPRDFDDFQAAVAKRRGELAGGGK